MTKRRLFLAALLAFPALALAQTSASYKLTESTMNNGGDPLQRFFAASASYHITLDAVGAAVSGVGLASASQRLDGGFVATFPPPAEVIGQNFSNNQSMTWTPEKSVGQYQVYRDVLSALGSGGTGTCLVAGLTGEMATDASVPALGAGYFYVITARNRLGEEGTKGFRTGGTERPNPTPCP